MEINVDSVVSGVAFSGCGALTGLEGDDERVRRGLMVIIASR